jgi:PmbA protein
VRLEPLIDALSASRPTGARVEGWSVCVTESRRLALGTKDGMTGSVHAPLGLSEGCGARYLLIWEDARVSRGYLERRQIEVGPAQALERARAACYDDPDAAQVRGPGAFPEVPLREAAAEASARGNTGAFGDRLARIRETVRARGFRTWSGGVSAGESRSRIVTSAGLDALEETTIAAWHASFDGELGDGHVGRAWDGESEFELRLGRLADTVAALSEPSDPPDRPPTVLLHPDVVEELVLGMLLENLSGAAVALGESAFRKEDFGSGVPILREDLSLRFDPTQPLRAGSYRFTSEGIPSAPCTLIEEGRLVTPLLDLKYARRLRMPPTPSLAGYDTLRLEGPEPLAEEEAWARAEGGVLVLNVLGVHTQDAASGDFSVAAPQALRVGLRGPRGRLRPTLSGNLLSLLRAPSLQLVRFPLHPIPGLLVGSDVTSVTL